MISERTQHGSYTPLIDWGNPLTRGLGAYLPMLPLVHGDLARPGVTVTRSATWPFVPGPFGNALNGAESYLNTPPVSATPGAECYMVAFSHSSTAFSGGLLGLNGAGGGNGLVYSSGVTDCILFYRGSSNNTACVVGASAFDGTPHVVIVQVPSGLNAAVATTECYLDGVKKTIKWTDSSGGPETISSLLAGRNAYGAFRGSIHAAAMWKRMLSPNEIAAISADPFAVLRRRARSPVCVPQAFTGYRLYRGAGESLGAVDYSNPVATAPQGAAARAFTGLGHQAGSAYTYVLRPVLAGLEMPNITARCQFETDLAGEWVGNRPAPAGSVSARVLAGGQIRVSWSYRTPEGRAPVTQFAVYHGSSGAIVPGAPQATTAFEGDGPYSCTFTLTDGQAYWFAVTALDGEGLESAPGESVGPCVARASGPNPPTLTIETTF